MNGHFFKRQGTVTVTGALVVLAMVLAGCGQSAATPSSPVASASGKPAPSSSSAKPAASVASSTNASAKPAAGASSSTGASSEVTALYDAAKKEGQVVWYTSINLNESPTMVKAFEAKYPGIKVDLIRDDSEKLVQRLTTEIKGGKTLADVLDTSAMQWLQVLQEGDIAAWLPPSAAGIPADLKDPKNFWFGDRVNEFAIQCNTNKVKPADCHNLTVDSLTDPKWKGDVLIEEGDVQWMLALEKTKYKGDLAKTEDVFKKLAANSTLEKGHTQTSDLLAAGKGSVFADGYMHRVYALMDKKAPVDFSPKEIVIQPELVGLVKNGPHPNAAKLLENWMLGPDGAAEIAKVGRVPTRTDVKLKHDFHPQGTTFYYEKPEFAADMAQYQKIWNQIFGLK